MGVKAIHFLTAAFMLSWFAGGAAATTYRWTDDRGGVHFTDTYDTIPSRYRDRVRIEKEATPSVIPRVEQRQEREEPLVESGAVGHAGNHHDRKKRHHHKRAVKAPSVPVSPARRAQDRAEERIRRERRAIEESQLPARRAQGRAEEQIQKAREKTMGH